MTRRRLIAVLALALVGLSAWVVLSLTGPPWFGELADAAYRLGAGR